MRTAVRDTSLEAYHALQASPRLSLQQQRIVEHIAALKGYGATRAEIAQATGMRLSSVCGRVNELVELYVLEDGPRRPCSVTGSSAHVVRAKPAQSELFDSGPETPRVPRGTSCTAPSSQDAEGRGA